MEKSAICDSIHMQKKKIILKFFFERIVLILKLLRIEDFVLQKKNPLSLAFEVGSCILFYI